MASWKNPCARGRFPAGRIQKLNRRVSSKPRLPERKSPWKNVKNVSPCNLTMAHCIYLSIFIYLRIYLSVDWFFYWWFIHMGFSWNFGIPLVKSSKFSVGILTKTIQRASRVAPWRAGSPEVLGDPQSPRPQARSRASWLAASQVTRWPRQCCGGLRLPAVLGSVFPWGFYGVPMNH